MTNNEAAKWIQLYIDLAKIDPTTGEAAYLNDDARKTIEAMEMAINALTAQQAAETHDKCTETYACDCVSRQAVQEIVDRIGGMYPYRQIGNRDSYSQYNEAWTDAINRVDAELNSLPSAQSTMGQQNDGDTISRRMAIDAMANTLWHYPNECYRNLNEYEFAKSLAELGLKSVPAAHPEITLESAIDYLHKIGWMQEHDRILTESAQPEIIHCKDCKFWREHKYAKETKRYIPFCGFNAIYTKSDDFCSKAERRTDG